MLAGWLTWALTLLGLVYLVTEAAITAPLRVPLARLHPLLASLLYCPACSGFWIGLGLYGLYPGEAIPTFLRAVLSGLGAMALSTTWSKATGGNSAWDAEAPLREAQHDEAPTSEAKEGD